MHCKTRTKRFFHWNWNYLFVQWFTTYLGATTLSACYFLSVCTGSWCSLIRYKINDKSKRWNVAVTKMGVHKREWGASTSRRLETALSHSARQTLSRLLTFFVYRTTCPLQVWYNPYHSRTCLLSVSSGYLHVLLLFTVTLL